MARRFIFALIVMTTMLAASTLVNAQEELPESPLRDQTWVRLGGPPGGVGYDIYMSPDNPDNMIVTDAMAGFHFSTDRGQTWFTSNQGVDLRSGASGDVIPVFSVRYDPNDAQSIWLGLKDLGGIFYSQDGGESWERRMNGIVETYALAFRGFAIQPGNSDVVYAAAEIGSDWWFGEYRTGGGYELVQGVIYKSTDRGMSWRAVWRGDNLVRYILIDPTDVDIMYASTGIFDREAANSNWESRDPGGVGMLKSTDGGETWFQINNGLNNLYINSIDFHPEDPRIILAGSRHANPDYDNGGGIYVTRDGGESWEYMGGADITAVEFADNFPDYAYAMGQNEFFRSFDGGFTWEQLHYPVSGSWGPERMVSGLAMDILVDPDDPMLLYVNSYQGGNFISPDGGETWQVASTGYSGSTFRKILVHAQNPAIIYTTGRTGPFISMDGGRQWQPISPVGTSFEGSAIAFDPLNEQRILTADLNIGCIRESVDLGENWTSIICHDRELTELWQVPDFNPGFMAQGPSTIIFSTSDPNMAYAGFGVAACQESLTAGCDIAPIKGLLISDDAGRSWSTPDDPLLSSASVSAVVVHPQDPNIIWAGSSARGVLASDDGGITWFLLSPDLSEVQITSLARDTSDPNIAYAGVMSDGVYRSQDGGATWQPISAGMNPNTRIRAIAIDPNYSNVVYAGSDNSGVFLSEDFGETWIQINDGLDNRAVLDLTISPDGLSVYVVTDGGGAYRLSTHDQDYFDALALEAAATPTALPTATLGPTASSFPQPTTTPAIDAGGSDVGVPWWVIGLAVVIPGIGLILFIVLRRKDRS